MSRPSLILCREARASEPCQAGSMSTPTPPETPRITVQANGPYLVLGGLPLRRKRAVVSEHAEPLAWRTEDVVHISPGYALCRCGGSANKPFCDGTHKGPTSTARRQPPPTATGTGPSATRAPGSPCSTIDAS